MDWFTDWFFGWWYKMWYGLQKTICWLIDFVGTVFNKLIGLDAVSIEGENANLLEYFIQSPQVRNAFFGVMLVGIILLVVFVIIAIIRSEYQEGQAKRTKGQILTRALHSFLIFVLLPVIMLAAIMFTGVIMQAIDMSMTATADGSTGNACFGGQILITSGSEAYIGPEGLRSQVEQYFMNGTYDYMDISVVKQFYDLSRINYFIGIVSGLILLILFAVAVIVFIQRIFDIILLYIISPVSVATIPLDDGNRFRIWREMAVSKVLGAYGIILAMNLFFIIVPQLNSIRFFSNNFQNGVMQLLIIIGGAFAVTKANIVISQLTGNNAGQQEIQQMMGTVGRGYRMVRGGAMMAATATGRLIGGTDFRNNQRHGVGFGDNVYETTHSKRNRHEVKEEGKTRSTAEKAGAVTRLATLPVGILKDAIQGGLVTAGRNFLPRLRNVAKGSSWVSHADIAPKAKKQEGVEGKSDEGNKPQNPPKASLETTPDKAPKFRNMTEAEMLFAGKSDTSDVELAPVVAVETKPENKKSVSPVKSDAMPYLRKTYKKDKPKPPEEKK